MEHVYAYILVAGLVSTLVRVLPAFVLQKKIENKYFQSFLYYLPYVTLAVMTFPAIIQSTEYLISGIVALIVGVIIAWFKDNLFLVASATCVAVFISEYLCGLF